jgi:hypothetical protein
MSFLEIARRSSSAMSVSDFVIRQKAASFQAAQSLPVFSMPRCSKAAKFSA